MALFVKNNLIKFNRREFSTYYNNDVIGFEVCGALKNVFANLNGVSDAMNLVSSIPGTIFSRAGVEIRSISKILDGGFQAFFSQAGIGDMYVTVFSEASKNYRYCKNFYKLFDGNYSETHLKVSQKIDGTPEGPNTVKKCL